MRVAVKTAFVGGFVVVVGLFLLATATTVMSLGRIRSLDAQLTALDRAKHQGHMTLVDVQQLYIHQVHTVIAGDRSHLDHYEKARLAGERRLRQLFESCAAIEVESGLAEIREVVDGMHRYFATEVLPDLGAMSPETEGGHYARLDRSVSEARRLVISLNRRLEERSGLVREGLEQVLRRTQVATLGTLSLAAVAAVVVGLYLTQTIVRPLARFHRAFVSVGAGELDTRVEARGPRELSDLAAGFNEMAAALAGMRENVAQNERMAVMGELASGVAHELNNPLGVIKGYLKIARRAPLDDQVAGDLDIISQEVRKCQETVRGLKELARPARLSVEQTDVAALVQDIVERMEVTSQDPMARVHVSVPEDPVRISIDPLAMECVIANLLNNAFDAAGPEGDVDIRVTETRRGVSISVGDSGRGIDPSFRDDLFKPFKTTKPSGMGLGLAISQATVKSHGGRIDTGPGPRGGALFTVELPDRETTPDRAGERG